MAKYSKEKENEHKEYVRELVIMNPHITIFETQKKLKETRGLAFDKDYVNKILNCIAQERVEVKYSQTKIQVFSYFEKESVLAKKILWEIVNDKASPASEKATALREIRNWSTSLIDRMIASNVFSANENPNYSYPQNMTAEELKKENAKIEERIKEKIKKLESLGYNIRRNDGK